MFHVEQLPSSTDFEDHLLGIRDRDWVQPLQARNGCSASEHGPLGCKQHQVVFYTLERKGNCEFHLLHRSHRNSVKPTFGHRFDAPVVDFAFQVESP